jgi:hypothetical protein
LNYLEIKALAKRIGCTVPDLLVLARGNDPFYIGTPTHVAQAEWFAGLWEGFGYPTGVHLRRLHYRIVGLKEPPQMHDGRPYLNTEGCWEYLNFASKYARILGLVDPKALVDRRNPTPRIYFQRAPWMREDYPEVGWEHDWDFGAPSSWELPRIHTNLADDLEDITPPTLTPTGYEYDDLLQPYHVEVWAEKSTMNDVLMPLCRRTATNLVTGVGYLSITAIINLLEERVRVLEKPCRILYVSDFDPSGANMPFAVSRQIQYWLEHYGSDADIRLEQVILTAEQADYYDLTPIPIKDSDLAKIGFEARHGENSARELDALEVEHPGELRRLLEEKIAGFRDRDMPDKVDNAREEAGMVLSSEMGLATGGSVRDLEDIKREAAQVYDGYRERLEALSAELEEELAPLRGRLEDVRLAIQDGLGDLDPDLPPLPEPEAAPDDVGWLFDSRRSYLEQLDYYKRRKAGQ